MSYSIDQFKSMLSQEKGFASSNMYRVLLPTLEGKKTIDGRTIEGYSKESINLLCKATSIPGRQIVTQDRQIGMVTKKTAYGFQVSDVTLSFQCTNSFLLRRYFEDWQSLAVSNAQGLQYHAGYYNDYVAPIRIAQIRKPESFAVTSIDLGFNLNLPNVIEDQLPTIGGVDLGDLSEGRFDIAIVGDENVVYECLLEEAFPTSLSAISLSNDQDGLSEFSVGLSYKNWFDISPGQSRTLSDEVVDAVEGLINEGVSIIGSIFR